MRTALVVLVLVTVAACGRSAADDARPAPPVPTTEAPAPRADVGPAPLSARIELAAGTVASGKSLDGVLVVTNPNDVAVEWSDGACRPKWVTYFLPGTPPEFPANCEAGALTFEPGPTRLPFSVEASLTACSQAEAPDGGLPACGPPPEVMPQLEPGRYEVALHATGPALAASPVPVEVTAG